MTENGYVLLVFGMGVVTYLPRWAPLFFLSRRKLPRPVVDWLDLIPAAILSSLLLPALVTSGVPRHLDLLQPGLIAAVPTFLFAIRTRSLGGTVVAGMGLYWAAGLFF